MSSRERIHHNIFLAGLLTLAAAIPTNSNLINLVVVVLAINWLAEGKFAEKFKRVRNVLVWLPMLFYLLHIVALIYTSETSAGLKNIETKVLILVLPLLIGTSPWRLSEGQRSAILTAFLISCTVVSLVALGMGARHWSATGSIEFLVHEPLSENVGLQSIYHSLYLCFAACIAWFFLLRERPTLTWRVGLVLSIVFFFLMTVMLSSRMSLLLQIVINVGGGYYYASTIRRLPVYFSLVLVVAILGAVASTQIPILRKRIVELIETKFYFSPEENNANGLTLRLVKWQCSLEGWGENVLVGVGTGDTQAYLQVCYKEKNFWGYVFEYNSHNQYLQTALGLGILGLLSLGSCLIVPYMWAWRGKEYLFMALLAVLAFSFLTESVLERKQGVVFFSFFSALFTLILLTGKESKSRRA
jgi:O-antigen ligase